MGTSAIHPRARLASLIAAALALSCAARVRPADGVPEGAARYTVLMAASREAGSLVTWTSADGALETRFEFTDRGRGPRLAQRIAVDASGIPTALISTGHDYFKNAVDERFSVEAGKARWSNGAEKNEVDASGAYYAPMYGAPDGMAVLARALLAAPGKTLRLLPAGEARIEQVLKREVRGRPVALHAISGLSLAPEHVWLDRDGALFAAGDSWFAVVRQGFEGALGELVAAQDAVKEARREVEARSLSRTPRGALAIVGARLFDAEAGRVRDPAAVVIEGGRISAIGGAVPDGAEVIDGAGKMLVPGFWDMHVHMSDEDGLLHLAAGVTTARDLANDMDETLRRKQRIEEGKLLGPRLLLAGFIDGPGPYAGPTKVLVDSEEQARAAVARYAERGYAQIKIYSSVRPALVPGIVAEAHRRGLRVSGHVPSSMTAEDAVRAGFDELQHANFLFLNFWRAEVPDTRTPARFTAVAERAASLDLESPPVRAFVELLKERRTVVDPTLNIFEGMFLARRGEIEPGFAAVAQRLPAQVRRNFLGGGLPVATGKDEVHRASFRKLLAMVKLLHGAGVPLVAGTDALAGFAYHRELELYEAAGIPAPEVLRIATLGAARVMGLDKESGSISVGKRADLLLIDGDPAARIADVRKIFLVIKAGALLEPHKLYASMGVLAR